MEAYLPIGLGILTLVAVIAIPVIGWAFSSIHKKVDDVSIRLDIKIQEVKADAEAKRIETRDTLLELVEAKFDAIWSGLKDIKDEVKRHYDNKY